MRNLLDAGFAVACPEASSPYEPHNETEGQFWWSNVPPYNENDAADLFLWNLTRRVLLEYVQACGQRS